MENRRRRSHVDLIIMIIKFIDYLSCFCADRSQYFHTISRIRNFCTFYHWLLFSPNNISISAAGCRSCHSINISFLYWKLCLFSSSHSLFRLPHISFPLFPVRSFMPVQCFSSILKQHSTLQCKDIERLSCRNFFA